MFWPPSSIRHLYAASGSPVSAEVLIARLTADLRPVARHAVGRRLVVRASIGVTASVALVVATLGLRPDFPGALATPMFWVKLGYTLALGLVSLWALERLSRPATPARRRMQWLAVPLVVVAGLGAWQLGEVAGDERLSVLMGATAAVCPWRILLFSVPPFLALVWAIRGLAPGNVRLAGAVLGLCAGGLGAAAYALACTESTAPFLAAWYTLAIAGVSAIGFATAPWVLRW